MKSTSMPVSAQTSTTSILMTSSADQSVNALDTSAASAQSGIERPPFSLIDLLHRSNQLVNQRFMSSVGDAGPTPRQLAVLASVAASDGLSQTEISDATNIDRATTAEIVGRLTRLGLLKRRRTRQDARTYAVNLTDEGERVFNSARLVSERIESDLLTALTAADRAKLLQLLARLVARPAATV